MRKLLTSEETFTGKVTLSVLREENKSSKKINMNSTFSLYGIFINLLLFKMVYNKTARRQRWQMLILIFVSLNGGVERGI
jgi:hypothetical protein